MDRKKLNSVSPHLVEAINLLGQLESEEESEEDSLTVILINTLINTLKLDKGVFEERLDESLLAECSLIEDLDTFSVMTTKIRTQMLYVQDKHSLFREESEGFGRLIRFLFKIPLESKGSECSVTVTKLIGMFNLDPNRVLPVVIQCLQSQYDNCNSYSIIKLFDKDKIKFCFRMAMNTKFTRETCLLLAGCFENNILSYEELVEVLPTATLLVEKRKTKAQEMYSNVMRSNITTLNLDNRQAADSSLYEYFYSDKPENAVEHLIEYFLLKKKIPVAERLIKLVSHSFDPTFNRPISLELCSQLTEALKANNTVLVESLASMLNLGLMHCLSTFHRYVNYLKNCSDTEELRTKVNKIVFPTLALTIPSAGLLESIYSLLLKFSVEGRYAIYLEQLENLYSTHPFLYVKKAMVTKETSRELKSLSNETCKAVTSRLVPLYSSNPILFLDNAFLTLTNYDNLIENFVKALAFGSPMLYDIFTFTIHKYISKFSSFLTENNKIQPAFVNLCSITGKFFSLYPKVDFSSVINYVVNSLETGSFLQLLLLKELLSEMTGWTYHISDSKNSQLSLSGGISLVNSVNSYSLQAKQHLIKFFLENKHNLFFRIVKAIDVIKNTLSSKESYDQIKLCCSFIDDNQVILNTLIDLFSYSLSSEEYASLLPDTQLQTIVIDYQMRPETIFAAYRKKIGPAFKMTEEERARQVAQYSKVFTRFNEMSRQESIAEFDSSFLQLDSFHAQLFKSPWQALQPEFYFLFWNLSVSDIQCPEELYRTEINRLELFLSTDFKESTFNSKSLFRREKESKKRLCSSLRSELDENKVEQSSLTKFIEENKDKLLNLVEQDNIEEVSKYFVQICLLPRILLGKTEAHYCIKFIHLISKHQVTNFYFLQLVSKIIVLLVPVVTSLTENEAKSMGFFVFHLFVLLDFWKEEANFKAECENNTCFSRTTESFTRLDLKSFAGAIQSLKTKMCKLLVEIFESFDNFNVNP